jgi:Tfp pilus assembly protein PilN
MSPSTKVDVLRVGGEPRVDLLPPELLDQRKAAGNRRRLGLGVVLVLVLVLGGTAAATVGSIQAQAKLLTAQSLTQSLLAQQKKYIEVQKVQDEVSAREAAQQVGTSTEIDWKKYLTAVQGTLPARVTLTTITIGSASPLTTYTQATVPLQGSRVATLSFAVETPSLPQVPVWLNALPSLPGYVDAVPGSVTRDDTTGLYTVNITMHINGAAFSKRFAAKGN